MIGLGTWLCQINTMFYKGKVDLKVWDENGAYGLDLIIPGFELPDFAVKEVTEDGDQLHAVVGTSFFKNKDIVMDLTFEGDTVNGIVKMPMIGKVKVTGEKTA